MSPISFTLVAASVLLAATHAIGSTTSVRNQVVRKVAAYRKIDDLEIPSIEASRQSWQACESNEFINCVDYEDVCDDFDCAKYSKIRQAKLFLKYSKIRQAKQFPVWLGKTNTPSQPVDKETVAKRKSTRPMIWIHVHKNAGSTICLLALSNGEKVASPHINCNYVPDWASCATRRQVFADQGATWSQLEHTINAEDFCDGFHYGIMLRDPVEHATSMTLYESKDLLISPGLPGIDPDLPTTISERVKSNIACIRNGECIDSPRYWSWRTYDNFMIRMMLGGKGQQIAPGRVTKEHAEEVIDIIRNKVHVISFMDTFADSLPSKLNWRTSDLHANPTRKLKDDSDAFSSEDLQFLQNNTMMDRMVYDYFRSTG